MALLFACLSTALGTAGQEVAGQSPLEQGIELLGRGDYPGAVASLTRAKKLEPGNPQIHLALGLAATCLRDLSAAKAEYLAALEARPDYAAAHNAMGLLLLKTGDVGQATTHFQNAVRFDATYAEARTNLAYALCTQGIAAGAVKECQTALTQTNGYPFLHEVAATANILSGALAGATEQLRQLQQSAATTAALVDLTPGSLEAGKATTGTSSPFTEKPAESGGGLQSLELTPSRGRLVMDAPLPAPITVSGAMAVTASSLQKETQYVAFLLDGAMRAVTNKSPYTWVWDTSPSANGPHVVAIQAYGAGGVLLGQQFRHVALENAPAPPPPTVVAPPAALPPADRVSVESNLRTLLRVRADPTRPRLILAKSYEKGGQRDAALTEYTRLFVEDPTRSEAHEGLRRLRQGAEYRPLVPATEVWRVEGAGPCVALTFDDGPRPFFTEKILEILRQHRARATFFLVGKMAAAYPDLVRAIQKDGHELANHSFSHPNMATLTTPAAEREVLQAELAIRQASQRRTRLFRPPGGNYNGNVRAALRELGYVSIFWGPNITSWKGRAPEEIAGAMARQAAEGDLLLLHNGKDETVHILELLIQNLTERGFRFVTVSELLKSGRPVSAGRAGETNEY
ncbi:MAG: hypothetical protein COZ06_09940 [Armatimonadetes bacterium CG_4_10_14_3_um_filter_66_18]|nr:polysaccharide deacetylase family protein [Armatimonadota bacterium]OIP02924.1 MAG: hypothetical protein AUJ96_15665 [Armatimonadetes bacterium CG2_30_66_41]PIU90223.1 MAG: hypothetical protein COS65_26005 [Armatimonadetes bacterium CG06_land_8_20_14_3_00_66_21]PIX46035.1 MAG: hypothetical protein COZ57_13660 [Armatimonadetes bacterium CG_4_8_14_3_um_filter_66_20]PIY50328.1 MAG: hypothetical protein COZ06_09940 [Armatimonadetes bacterium CG_4_10_14_3_um_filter_66_18]PIZ43133.1 MAG: hypothet